MDTSVASTAATASSLPASARDDSGAASNASALSSDFETFLRMLTVQMQNQDPLNPVESSDFAVQLATFSGVEQQVRSNDLLKSLLSQQSVSALSQLANWVGMDVRGAVPAEFDGSNPVTYYPDPPPGADQATLIVRNADGLEVSRIAVSPGSDPATWDGTDQSGARLPDGSYRFSVEYRAGGELLAVAPVEVYARVSEARLTGGVPVVVFANGEELPAGEVTSVRAPQD